MSMPEAGRRAAHTIVDAVSAFEPGADDNAEVLSLALSGIVDHITVDEDADGNISVDAGDLAWSSVYVTHWLVTELAAARNADEHTIIAELRAYLDE